MSILKVANVHFEATGTNRIDYLGDDKVRITSANGTVLSGSTTDAMMRITQTGTGHALVVEDSDNPDFSPFVVTANGRVIMGANTSGDGFYEGGPHLLQVHQSKLENDYEIGVDDRAYGTQLAVWANTIYSHDLYFTKSRGNSVNEHVAVQPGDGLMWISATGSNGTMFAGESIAISAVAENGISGNSVPGRLAFYTTSPGNALATERMRIDSNGNIGIGATDLDTSGWDPGSRMLKVKAPGTLEWAVISLENSSGSGRLWLSGNTSTGDPYAYVYAENDTLLYIRSGKDLVFGAGTSPEIEPMRLSATGNVLIGRTDSTVGLGVKLDVNGSINCANLFVNGGAVSGGAVITDQSNVDPIQYLTFTTTTSGTASSLNVATTKLTFNVATGTLSSTIFNSTSDINKKTDLRQINDSMYLIDNLKGYRFNWKENHLPSLGVVAQEVEAVLPELISDDKSVNYNGLIAVLIEAVKELKAEIEVLKSGR